MRKVGITTTIPVEVIFAANCIPVDLNNIFITHSNPETLISFAEEDGFPRTICSWIKGLYSVAIKKNIKEIIAVMEGDCSNTHALAEIWLEHNLKIIPFSFPYNKDKNILKHNIEKLMDYFKVSYEEVYKIKKLLDNIRKKLNIIDIATYRENIVTGFENHLFLVSASDFQSDFNKFNRFVDRFLLKVEKRKPFKEKVRLGVIGVPPIILDFYEQVEKLNARVVFNEVQSQFAMLSFHKDIVNQYVDYTYPYSVYDRLKNIKQEIINRKIDGIIHYVQAFCFRNIQDKIFKKHLNIPILTLEGDKPEKLDQRNKIRIESFIDMLNMKKHKRHII